MMAYVAASGAVVESLVPSVLRLAACVQQGGERARMSCLCCALFMVSQERR